MKKMNRFLVSLLVLIISNVNITAQLKVHSTGNIGIEATNPVSKFALGGDGTADTKVYIYNSNTGTSYKGFRVDQAMPSGTFIYGMFSYVRAGQTSGFPVGIFGGSYRGATAYTSGRSIGVKGQAGNASPGWNYSVYGELMGSNNGAAIYGVVPGKGDIDVGGIYAGYFRGNVKIENDLNVAGVFTNSDITLKKDVINLESNNVEKLKQLQAIKYKLKLPSELPVNSPVANNNGKSALKDTTSAQTKALILAAENNDPVYKKEYIGLSAQEIQKVFPDIVKVEDNGYLSVNYIALIPVLIEAIKEQQVTIDELKKQMESLAATKE